MSKYRPYPKYKPSGVEWLGDVPEGWEVKPLKVIASFNDDVLPESFGEDEEIEYVDIGSVSLETGIERTETFRFGDAPSRARRRVRDGDVIASTVRTYLKAIAPVMEPPSNLIVSTGFAVIRPRNGLDSHFAKFSLQSGYFVDEVISRSTGVSYPAINASEMAAISLSLPPLPEQIQIADFLDRECGKLDALQAKQQRLIELLKEKRQALISHAVTKGLPGVASAKTGLDPTAKLKPSGIEWLGDVPEHWRTLKLGHVCKLQGGFAFKADEFGDEGIPVIRMKNLSRGKLDLDEVARVPVTSTNSSVALQVGDLLWGMSGSVGDTGSLGNYAVVSADDLPAQLNQRVGRFIPNTSKLLNEFLCRAIQASSFYEQILLEVTGTAQFNVSSSQVESCFIALPPLAEQRAIVAHLDEKCGKIDQLKAKAERGIELLKERRSALISAAVTGKIDVRDM